jgi:hypothetical protein
MVTEITVAVATALIIGLGTLAYRAIMRGLKAYMQDEVRSHLVPNGGGSLADRLTKVEKAVDKLTAQAEETGCLPGCPMRAGYAPTETPAHWQWIPREVYGSPPDWATSTQPRSRPATPMPKPVAPTSSMTHEQMK